MCWKIIPIVNNSIAMTRSVTKTCKSKGIVLSSSKWPLVWYSGIDHCTVSRINPMVNKGIQWKYWLIVMIIDEVILS